MGIANNLRPDALRNRTLPPERPLEGMNPLEVMNAEEDDMLGCIELAEERGKKKWRAAKVYARRAEEEKDEDILIQCARLRNGVGHGEWEQQKRLAREVLPDARRFRVGRTQERLVNDKGPNPNRARGLLNTVYVGVDGLKVDGQMWTKENANSPSGGSKRRRQSRKKLSKKIRARNVKKTNRKLKKRGKTHRKRIIKTIGNKK